MKNFTESDMYEPIKKFFVEMGYDVKKINRKYENCSN